MRHDLRRFDLACPARISRGGCARWAGASRLAVSALLAALALPTTALGAGAPPASPLPSSSTSGLSTALQRELVPHDSALDVALELDTGTYRLPVTAPGPGHLNIRWLLGRHPTAVPAAGLMSIARGATTLTRATGLRLAMTETRRGRDEMRHHQQIALTAVATFTPLDGTPVRAATTFTLA